MSRLIGLLEHRFLLERLFFSLWSLIPLRLLALFLLRLKMFDPTLKAHGLIEGRHLITRIRGLFKAHRALLRGTKGLESRRGLVIFYRLGLRSIWLAAERFRCRSEPLFRLKRLGLLIEMSFRRPLHLLVVNVLKCLVKTARDRLDLLHFGAHLLGLDQVVVHSLIAEFILAGRRRFFGLGFAQAPLIERFDIV